MDWTDEDVRKYTFDNIHPNQAGSDEIYRRLKEKMTTFFENNGKSK